MSINIFKKSTNLVLVLFLFLSQFSASQAPIAGISSSPAPLLGNLLICSNSSVVFTSSSTQTNGQTIYSWDFGTGATPQNATGNGPHIVTYDVPNTTNTLVTLIVNNANGQLADTASQIMTINYLANPSLTLTSSGSGFSSGTANGITLFKQCDSNNPQLFEFQSNYTDTVQQIFNWGDGSSSNQSDMLAGQITHLFPIGQFTVTHTVTIGNCSKTTEYIVFNGSSPVISVSGSGQTTCLPSPYSIDIASNDVPINYIVSFSDSSQSSSFSTSNDTTVSHIFNSSSCGVEYVYAPGVPPIQNAFSVSVLAQNLCSNGFPTVFTIGPITVSTGPVAEFNYSPSSPICQGEAVSFENTSTNGENISENSCDSTYSFYWKILQPNGYVINNGTLGSANGFIGLAYDYTQWINGTDLDITFNTPGDYEIMLYAANSCGIDSVLKVITINPTATVVFDPSNQAICSGDETALITMNSTVPGYTINWEITDTTNVQGAIIMSGSGVSPVEFDSIMLYNSSNVPGTMEISATVGCTSVPPTIYTITVNPEGNISADPLASLICSSETTAIDITSNLSGATFSWTTSGPNTIIGETDGSGSATINQSLTNNGSTIDTMVYSISIGGVACPGPDVLVSVAVQPLISINQNLDITVCEGEEINPDDYISTPSGASISWTNSNTLIGIDASGNGNLPTWLAPQNTTGTPFVGTITVNAQLNDCPSVQDEFTITINPSPLFSYDLLPSSGLDCTTNTATIIGVVDPPTCSVNWVGPSILSGETTLTPIVNLPGIYTITITENTSGCVSMESIQIDPPTPIAISQVDITPVSCFGGGNGSIAIQTNNSSNLEYSWTPNISTNPTAENLSTGIYSVIVTNEDGCTDDTTVFVSQATQINLMIVDSIWSECEELNGSITMTATGGQGGYSYVWSNGQTGAVLSEVDAGSYSVTVTDNLGCSISTSLSLGCTPLIPIVIPQFLSPNYDSKNDIWIIQNLEFYPDNKVTVYNRWGNIVFEAEPYSNNWNGHYRGTAPESLPASTYFYVVDTKKKSQDPYTGYIEIQP